MIALDLAFRSYQSILEGVSPIDYINDHIEAQKGRYADLGLWLFKDDKFEIG
jgi:hypothetical protein